MQTNLTQGRFKFIWFISTLSEKKSLPKKKEGKKKTKQDKI